MKLYLSYLEVRTEGLLTHIINLTLLYLITRGNDNYKKYTKNS